MACNPGGRGLYRQKIPVSNFATLQTPFTNNLISTCTQLHYKRGKSISWKSRVSEYAWNIHLCDPGKGSFKRFPLPLQRGPLTKAAMVVEPVQIDGCKAESLKLENVSIQTMQSLGEDSDEMDEREKSRRLKISKANKGKVPWNKGRKHSEETRQRIQERTKLAMQNPKVKMKLVNLGHAQSDATKVKIGQGVRMGWERRRRWLQLQETCCFAWQNAVAEASRKGFAGDDELQWDSYGVINEQLKIEWLESVEQRKSMPRPKGGRRAPKSLEQRKKISQAISAKWADPEYRGRVCSALAKFHGIPPGMERKPKRRPVDGADATKRDHASSKPTVKIDREVRLINQPVKAAPVKKRKHQPSFKDPLAGSKLEMIKNIREERSAMEIKKREAIEKAKMLISKAEKAAEALEVAALTNTLARVSLSQARRLIAQATESIESIEGGSLTTADIDVSSVSPDSDEGDPAESIYSTKVDDHQYPEKKAINGTHHPSLIDSDDDEAFNFTKFALQNLLNSKPPLNNIPYSQDNSDGRMDGSTEKLGITLSSSDRLRTPDLQEKVKVENVIKADVHDSLENMIRNSYPKTARKKQWVCGRLVEVESA